MSKVEKTVDRSINSVINTRKKKLAIEQWKVKIVLTQLAGKCWVAVEENSVVNEDCMLSTSKSVRGTQRLFSVKYLFGETNIASNFLLLEDNQKFPDDCSIHVKRSKLM